MQINAISGKSETDGTIVKLNFDIPVGIGSLEFKDNNQFQNQYGYFYGDGRKRLDDYTKLTNLIQDTIKKYFKEKVSVVWADGYSLFVSNINSSDKVSLLTREIKKAVGGDNVRR